MTQTPTTLDPPVPTTADGGPVADDAPPAPLAPPYHADDLVAGRPVEDRGFEAMETTLGLVAGAAIGAVVAGPVGAVVGGVAGAAGAFAAGEAFERHEGLAARSIDATEPEDARTD
jgi:hypothetical protein